MSLKDLFDKAMEKAQPSPAEQAARDQREKLAEDFDRDIEAVYAKHGVKNGFYVAAANIDDGHFVMRQVIGSPLCTLALLELCYEEEKAKIKSIVVTRKATTL